MSRSIEELEAENKKLRSICNLQKELENAKSEKESLEETYNMFKSSYDAYCVDINNLKEQIYSLRRELNNIQAVTGNKKIFPPDIDINEIMRNISEINTQIEGLFQKVKLIVEFRQKQMKKISDEIEGDKNK